MTIARPIPIEFNAALDPTSYNDPIPQNLGLVQGEPTLKNSTITYSTTTVASSFGTAQIPNQLPSSFVQDSDFRLADNALVNIPEEEPKARDVDGSQAHCCEKRERSDSIVGCRCAQTERDYRGQLGGQSDGYSDGQPDGQSDRQSDRQSGRQEEGKRREDNDSRPGLWQLYVQPWMCGHIPWNTC